MINRKKDEIKMWIFNRLFCKTKFWLVNGNEVSNIITVSGMRLPSSIVKSGRFCIDYTADQALDDLKRRVEEI